MVRTNEAIDIAQSINQSNRCKAIAHVSGNVKWVQVMTDYDKVVPFEVVEESAKYGAASLVKDGPYDYRIE